VSPEVLLLSKKTLEEIQLILKAYPTNQACLLPVLYLVQKEQGYISEEFAKAVAGLLGLPFARVEEVLTFYTLFSRRPQAKYVIQVCRGLSCALLGQEELLAFLKNRLRVKEGEITPDGLFEFKAVECLGACGSSPVVRVNDTYYEFQTVDRLESILKELSADTAKESGQPGS
jgi:NADH-quinone oxidoreductase subunit E